MTLTSENIRAELARKQATRAAAARAAGMSLATWYRRLRADNWRVVELERLSVYLEVPLSRFTDGPK